MQRTLGIFAKLPQSGAVKTRLAAGASPEWAAEVYQACLLDVLEKVRPLAVSKVLAYDPPSAAAAFASIAQAGFTLTPQAEGDLGQRMTAFFVQQFAAGSHAVVILGSDSPTLPVQHIAQAFAELARADVVLGPCTDGGFYLVGCQRELPAGMLDNVRWSTRHALADTVARLAGRRLALLPPWYDVDSLEDWEALRGHVVALRAAGVDPQCPRVEALL